jgi:hypothetical protein
VSIRFRPVADACGAPVLHDQGPDRPAGHGKDDASLDDKDSLLAKPDRAGSLVMRQATFALSTILRNR